MFDNKLAILNDAGKKVKQFNRIGVHYEAVYHHIIRKRLQTKEIWDDGYIDVITAGLISFDMQRMMGKSKYLHTSPNSWASKLKAALQPHRIALDEIKDLKLQKVNLQDTNICASIIEIFDHLSRPGILNIKKKQAGFSVGASKILHFLVPDLFIIVDSNSRRELVRHFGFPNGKIMGAKYIEAMRVYQSELLTWKELHDDSDFEKLFRIDDTWRDYHGGPHTPLPRIMDKCTFVGDKAS